jgi:hypothetical protein
MFWTYGLSLSTKKMSCAEKDHLEADPFGEGEEYFR